MGAAAIVQVLLRVSGAQYELPHILMQDIPTAIFQGGGTGSICACFEDSTTADYCSVQYRFTAVVTARVIVW